MIKVIIEIEDELTTHQRVKLLSDILNGIDNTVGVKDIYFDKPPNKIYREGERR